MWVCTSLDEQADVIEIAVENSTVKGSQSAVILHVHLRHHGIKKLAEAGVPEQVLMAIAGHVSREMPEHYSHIRQKAKRDAVEAIDSYQPAESVPADTVASTVN